MKTILVPTDFSVNAKNALDYAASLAKKENATLILLHAFHVFYPESEIPVAMVAEEIPESQRKAEDKLKKISRELAKRKKVRCEFICKEGLAVDVILEASKNIRPDLIIMGTKGASGIKEVTFGSNTARVIEKAAYPVIAVPAGAKFKGIRQIVFSTNYNASDLDALKKIVEIARVFQSRLILLHAADEEFTKEAEEMLMNAFRKKISAKIKYPRISCAIRYGRPFRQIIHHYVQEKKPDLLAMSTQRRGLLEAFFGTSITQKMAYHTNIPLLAFHHKKSSVIFT